MPKGEHLIGIGGVKKFGTHIDPTKGGNKRKPIFADILDEISDNDGIMEFDKFTIVKKVNEKGIEIEVVRIHLPSDTAMAISLLNKAIKDPKWFDLLLKVKRDMLLPKQLEAKLIIDDVHVTIG